MLNAKQQSTFDVEKCRTWVLPPGLVATLRLIFPEVPVFDGFYPFMSDFKWIRLHINPAVHDLE